MIIWAETGTVVTYKTQHEVQIPSFLQLRVYATCKTRPDKEPGEVKRNILIRNLVELTGAADSNWIPKGANIDYSVKIDLARFLR